MVKDKRKFEKKSKKIKKTLFLEKVFQKQG